MQQQKNAQIRNTPLERFEKVCTLPGARKLHFILSKNTKHLLEKLFK